jgi:hypothetical protein
MNIDPAQLKLKAGARIKGFWTGNQDHFEAKDDLQLILQDEYCGDHCEWFIIRLQDGKETHRYNLRYVETIIWDEELTRPELAVNWRILHLDTGEMAHHTSWRSEGGVLQSVRGPVFLVAGGQEQAEALVRFAELLRAQLLKHPAVP